MDKNCAIKINSCVQVPFNFSMVSIDINVNIKTFQVLSLCRKVLCSQISVNFIKLLRFITLILCSKSK